VLGVGPVDVDVVAASRARRAATRWARAVTMAVAAALGPLARNFSRWYAEMQEYLPHPAKSTGSHRRLVTNSAN
jgi:hypothetical protein